MSRLRLYLHALRVARPRQLRGRVERPLRRRRFPPPRAGARFRPIADAEPLWRSPAFALADEAAGAGEVRLLGKTFPFPPPDWTLPGEPRLRAFHLHYGEEVLGWARQAEVAAARAALRAWIDANPPRPGDAWHPYPLSTRVGNWIAALSLAPELVEEQVVESLARQLAYLERNVEDDILGNHVIRNARALVLGGTALEDRALLQRGEALLGRELPEQVLSDGGHYERSPVYHLIVLRDLLEARAAGVRGLDGSIGRMERFAAALARPDGAPALFNDGTLDLAPRLELPEPPQGLAVFEETGYAVLRDGGVWLAFDCGPPAPPYLPPHAHADALSFQLWVGGTPRILDPGTSTYEPGPTRARERSTAAHSTVAVGGRDQFEVWGPFRAGPLPHVARLSDGPLAGVVMTSWYRHERHLVLDADRLSIEDEIEASRPESIVSTLVFADRVPEGTKDVAIAPTTVAERFFRPDTAETAIMNAPAARRHHLFWQVPR